MPVVGAGEARHKVRVRKGRAYCTSNKDNLGRGNMGPKVQVGWGKVC